MNTHDQFLKDFLINYNYTESMETTANFEKLKEQAINIIENEKYSHIDFQDSDGNTFIHHAHKSREVPFVKLLLSKGADFYIKNKKGQTPIFYSNYNQTEIKFFWDELSPIYLDENFSKETKNYHPKIKQTLFEVVSSKRPFGNYKKGAYQVKDFLEDNQLLTVDNYIRIFKDSIRFAMTENNIRAFMDLNPTPKENSAFLHAIMRPVNHKNFSNEDKEATMDFLNQSSFEINSFFLLNIINTNFFKLKSYDPNGFDTQVIKKIFSILLEEDFRNNPDIKNECEQLDERLLQYKLLHNLFLSTKLEKNSGNLPIKKGLKI